MGFFHPASTPLDDPPGEWTRNYEAFKALTPKDQHLLCQPLKNPSLYLVDIQSPINDLDLCKSKASLVIIPMYCPCSEKMPLWPPQIVGRQSPSIACCIVVTSALATLRRHAASHQQLLGTNWRKLQGQYCVIASRWYNITVVSQASHHCSVF